MESIFTPAPGLNETAMPVCLCCRFADFPWGYVETLGISISDITPFVFGTFKLKATSASALHIIIISVVPQQHAPGHGSPCGIRMVHQCPHAPEAPGATWWRAGARPPTRPPSATAAPSRGGGCAGARPREPHPRPARRCRRRCRPAGSLCHCHSRPTSFSAGQHFASAPSSLPTKEGGAHAMPFCVTAESVTRECRHDTM